MVDPRILPDVERLAEQATPDNLADTLQQMRALGVPEPDVYTFAQAFAQDQRDAFNRLRVAVKDVIASAKGRA